MLPGEPSLKRNFPRGIIVVEMVQGGCNFILQESLPGPVVVENIEPALEGIVSFTFIAHCDTDEPEGSSLAKQNFGQPWPDCIVQRALLAGDHESRFAVPNVNRTGQRWMACLADHAEGEPACDCGHPAAKVELIDRSHVLTRKQVSEGALGGTLEKKL